MKIEDLNWLAGYLEGEGTFNASGAKNVDGEYTSICVQVSSTDEDVLERARGIVGATRVFPVKSSGKGYNIKQMYRVQVTGDDAVNLMMELFSHMGARRKQQIKSALLNCARVRKAIEERLRK